MFTVNGTDITITRGDTALLTIIAESEHVFSENDRVVFTVKQYGHPILVQTLIPNTDGSVQISFTHEITELLNLGSYQWDVRYVLDAEIDQNGNVVGGREVLTPISPSVLKVVEAVELLM